MNYFVEVKDTPHKGRGVFATKNFEAGDVIEECPVIVLSEEECKHCEKTVLDNYIYEWKSAHDGAIVLGYGFIYNHSFHPNADYFKDVEKKLLVYKAIKPIKKGEEIVVNYNGEPDDKTAIEWIDVVW